MKIIYKFAEKIKKKYSIKTPEAPASAPFGEYAWIKYREGFKDLDDRSETELEKKVYTEIRSHFASSHKGLSQSTVKLLQKILRNEWYSEVIHEPKQDTMYRGVVINDANSLAKILKLKEEEIGESGSIDASKLSIRTKNGFSSSWTNRKIISTDFSTYYGKRKRGYAVTLIAKIKDNPLKFIAGPGGLYDVKGLSRWHLEKESIGLEPIKLYRIEWKKLG